MRRRGTYGGRIGLIPRGAMQLILAAAGSLFLLPLIWMLATSLKPLDQTMSLPPTWIPRATMATLDGERVVAVKRRLIDQPSVLVIQRGGVDIDSRKLLPESVIADGKARTTFTRAGRQQPEPEPVAVDIVKPVPVGWWLVEEWAPDYSRADQGSARALRWDCVPPDDLESVPHAFWQNYPSALARMERTGARAWGVSGFYAYLFNTLWVCTLSVAGAVLSCTLVAYAFAFLEFPGRDWLFGLTLAVMMVPFPATMVPLFDLFRDLGWVGTFKPLWAPAWFGGAFFIFLLRQFFLGLPKDLLDAARIDGCSELQVLWHVVVPLARPALAMVALFQFLGAWKDFMGPLLYLNDSSQFTLSLGLQAFQSQHGGTPWHLSMAASLLFSLPLIVLFLVARKMFVQGIAMTGIKG
ncbi:MAG: carbohydrate ABC transporter permease [Planctomycetes bacterium]|nr:carbohydrate ABC transporter permease [Planctomycetota bacterium]